jgi:hypothetical protein
VAIEAISRLAQDKTEDDKEGVVEGLLSQNEIFAVWYQVKAFMRSGDAYQNSGMA